MTYNGLIAGLGNPGKQYHETRHNMGFMLIDFLLEHSDQVEQLNGNKFSCHLWKVTIGTPKAWWLVAKPQTYMNLSGQSIQPLLAWHKLNASNLIVLHDELDIPVGQLRFKFGGGNAGHNGLKSITAQLGTPDFYRLRLGIGRPSLPEHGDVSSFVLTKAKGSEQENLKNALPKAIEVIDTFIKDGLKNATKYALSIKE